MTKETDSGFDLPERIKKIVEQYNARIQQLPPMPAKITATNFGDVDGLLTDLKAIASEASESRLTITRPLDAGKKNIMDAFAVVTDPLSEMINDAERKIRIFVAEEEKRAERAAAKERARIEKKRERLIERAEAAEAKNDHDKAAALFAEAEALVEYMPERLKSSSTRNTEKWEFRVTDQSKLPPELLMPNNSEIGKRVRALKADHGIPGVTAWDANSIDVLKAQGRRKK